MKKNLLYSTVAASLMLAGCSAAFRTAQTPDDIYYSEGPANTNAMVQTTRSNQGNQRVEEGYTSYWETQDDDYLRMKVRDRNRWGAIDDIDYWQGYNNNMWVNYNTFNSPFGFNSWNNPMMMGFNQPFGMGMMHPWNQPFGFGNGWGWNNGFNNPWGMGFGMNRGFGMGMGMGMGFNQFGFGMNSWNNNWNNPWGWNQGVVIINKYPTRINNNPSRSSSTMSPYRNNSFNRSNTFSNGNRNTTPTRSIWETPGNVNGNNRATYRNVTRPGVDGGSRTFERPTRTFNTGGSTNSGGGATRSSGGGSSSGSAGSSSRGGRGG